MRHEDTHRLMACHGKQVKAAAKKVEAKVKGGETKTKMKKVRRCPPFAHLRIFIGIFVLHVRTNAVIQAAPAPKAKPKTADEEVD